MPVLTRKQRDRAAEAPRPEAQPKADVRRAPPPGPSAKVRMHHPDDPYHRMKLKMTVEGHPEFEVTDGIATVPLEVAAELERRGWLRGSEVKDA